MPRSRSAGLEKFFSDQHHKAVRSVKCHDAFEIPYNKVAVLCAIIKVDSVVPVAPHS